MIAALRRAIALAKREDTAFAVAKDLHFDVPREVHEFFEEYARFLEVAFTEPLDCGERVNEFSAILADAHSDSAAARGALEHHGISDAVRCDRRLFGACQQTRARQKRNAILLGNCPRGVFQAEEPHLLGRRPDEGQTCLLTSLREFGILAKKSIAGMNRLHSCLQGCGDDFVHAKVALADWWRTQQNGVIGLAHMQRVGISFRINGDCADPELLESSRNAAGDDAAIRDEDFGKHHSQIKSRTGVGL